MKGTEAQLPLSKRLLSVFFAIVLVVGLVPVTAWAEGDESQQSQNAQTSATQEQQADQAQVPETVTGGGETSDSSEQASDSSDQSGNEAALANESGEDGIAQATGLTISGLSDVTYSGESQQQTPTVTDKNGNTLAEGTDYDVAYKRGGEVTNDFTNAGTITVTVKGKGNYTGEATATYQIDPKGYTVTTESAEKVYDGTALTAGGKITGLVNEGDAKFTVIGSQTNAGESDNGYDIEFSSDQMEDNYKPVGLTVGTLTVNPAKVTVTADAKSKVYGEADPDLTAKVTGLVNGESEELITYDVSCKHDEEDAGTYEGAIVPSGDKNQGNYSVTYVPADFTIEKRAIEVSDSATVAYNGQEQVLNIDASKVSGLLEGDKLYLTGAQVKGTQPGTYTDVTEYSWDVLDGEDVVTKNYDLKVTGELTITKAGAAADNGTNSGDKAKTSSASPQTGDSTAPLAAGAAAAAIAAALAAFFVSRKLRGNAKH